MHKPGLKITLLGTGSSHGVPVNGCSCPVCLSEDWQDKRLRCAVFVQYEDLSILIDAGPDIRQQLLRAKVSKIDALLISHEHNDHVIGLDDLRPYNYISRRPLNLYCTDRVALALRQRFDYIFGPSPYGGALKAEIHVCRFDRPLNIEGHVIVPIEVSHGDIPVHGFRFGDFTYITDAKSISPAEIEKMEGTAYLVINALHYVGHISHFNVDEALEIIEQVKPRKAWLTHISHFMGRAEEVNKKLPHNVELAYDGLEINC
jgi:phosphoribosyl 1,2-cyclic phosphate phosphodiesterase